MLISRKYNTITILTIALINVATAISTQAGLGLLAGAHERPGTGALMTFFACLGAAVSTYVQVMFAWKVAKKDTAHAAIAAFPLSKNSGSCARTAKLTRRYITAALQQNLLRKPLETIYHLRAASIGYVVATALLALAWLVKEMLSPDAQQGIALLNTYIPAAEALIVASALLSQVAGVVGNHRWILCREMGRSNTASITLFLNPLVAAEVR